MNIPSGVSRRRRAGPWRCASSLRPVSGVSPLSGGRPSRDTVRPAVPAVLGARPVPVPGDRGPERQGHLSGCAAQAGPLAEQPVGPPRVPSG